MANRLCDCGGRDLICIEESREVEVGACLGEIRINFVILFNGRAVLVGVRLLPFRRVTCGWMKLVSNMGGQLTSRKGQLVL